MRTVKLRDVTLLGKFLETMKSRETHKALNCQEHVHQLQYSTRTVLRHLTKDHLVIETTSVVGLLHLVSNLPRRKQCQILN